MNKCEIRYGFLGNKKGAPYKIYTLLGGLKFFDKYELVLIYKDYTFDRWFITERKIENLSHSAAIKPRT